MIRLILVLCLTVMSVSMHGCVKEVGGALTSYSATMRASAETQQNHRSMSFGVTKQEIPHDPPLR